MGGVQGDIELGEVESKVGNTEEGEQYGGRDAEYGDEEKEYG